MEVGEGAGEAVLEDSRGVDGGGGDREGEENGIGIDAEVVGVVERREVGVARVGGCCLGLDE